MNKCKKASKRQKSVVNLVQALYEKGTIKEIKEKIAIIKEVLTDSFWRTLELDKLEHMRVELRDLIKHLKDDANGQTFNVDIEDFIEYVDETESLFSVKTYKQRVIDYLIENSWNPVIQKYVILSLLLVLKLLNLKKYYGTNLEQERNIINLLLIL